MSTVVVTDSGQRRNPGCLVQIIWFLLVGWWASQLWIAVAWLLMLTIIGIPFGVMMLNNLPKVIALRDPSSSGVAVIQRGRTTVITTGGQAPQPNILLRAIYFVLIGWWLSAIWMELAYIVTATIIGMPLGFWMFDKVPALVSLRR
ncbi:MAG: YccF domain-containing protein [Anaerolineae bacterium]